MNELTSASSRLAKERGLFLSSVDDALDVIGNGAGGCIFTPAELSADFFDLNNRVAGEVFQKFVNYGCRVAFVIPENHELGERVTELIREHRAHPIIRFFTSASLADDWLASTD